MDEIYIIRADLAQQPGVEQEPAGEAFLTENGSLGSFHEALTFNTLESAEAYLQGRGPSRREFVIQRCSREAAQPSHQALHQLIERIMEIPPPYRRSAYNWLRGKHVEAILRRQGEEVFERHRRALADHGIDITQPSTVILMRPKRKRAPIRTGDQRQGPRQFVAMPSQRPSPAPIRSDGEGEEER